MLDKGVLGPGVWVERRLMLVKVDLEVIFGLLAFGSVDICLDDCVYHKIKSS